MTKNSAEEMQSITLDGEVTIYSAEEVKQELFAHLSKGKSVVADLIGVSEFDTAGFQALLFGKRYAETHGIELRLESPSDAVKEVFGLYGMSELMESSNES